MASKNKDAQDKGQVRDQDGIPQGKSGEKNWTGQKNTRPTPGAHSDGQGAHDYTNQSKQVHRRRTDEPSPKKTPRV